MKKLPCLAQYHCSSIVSRYGASFDPKAGAAALLLRVAHAHCPQPAQMLRPWGGSRHRLGLSSSACSRMNPSATCRTKPCTRCLHAQQHGELRLQRTVFLRHGHGAHLLHPPGVPGIRANLAPPSQNITHRSFNRVPRITINQGTGMSNWMTDAEMKWRCSNAVWAEPNADLLVRKLLKMSVTTEVEMLVASDLEGFLQAQAMEEEKKGSGQAFMAAREQGLKTKLFNEEMELKQTRYQAAARRLEELKKKRDQELKTDANAYMNACGVCAGYTLLWLGNAMSGIPLVKPEERLAAESQGYLMTRWALLEEKKRFLPARSRDRVEIYRKALKHMALWKTTVTEVAQGKWDWHKPGMGKESGSVVFVEGSGAKKVWAAVRDGLKDGGGALLAITLPGAGGKLVGHALAFYRQQVGGPILAFDANFGLGSFKSDMLMPGAIDKLRACYGINYLERWTVYRVGITDATPIFENRLI
ncbi:MAG: hypothetical protein H7Z19_19175 [Chitinophagaceae bacterium]|nr:hypothetical protein [Rubrivivax sp.]